MLVPALHVVVKFAVGAVKLPVYTANPFVIRIASKPPTLCFSSDVGYDLPKTSSVSLDVLSHANPQVPPASASAVLSVH